MMVRLISIHINTIEKSVCDFKITTLFQVHIVIYVILKNRIFLCLSLCLGWPIFGTDFYRTFTERSRRLGAAYFFAFHPGIPAGFYLRGKIVFLAREPTFYAYLDRYEITKHFVLLNRIFCVTKIK